MLVFAEGDGFLRGLGEVAQADLSSGCIERAGGRGDAVAEVPAEVLVGPQLHLTADGSFEFEFHLGEVEQARCPPGLELDEEIDVADRSEVRAQGGSVEGEPADPVAHCELVEEGVLDDQPFSQLHVIMPHAPALGLRCFDVLTGWASAPLWETGRRLCGRQADEDVDVPSQAGVHEQMEGEFDDRAVVRVPHPVALAEQRSEGVDRRLPEVDPVSAGPAPESDHSRDGGTGRHRSGSCGRQLIVDLLLVGGGTRRGGRPHSADRTVCRPVHLACAVEAHL